MTFVRLVISIFPFIFSLNISLFAQKLMWANSLGGEKNDISNGIKQDYQGNSFIVGAFSGHSKFDSISTINDGAYDAYLAKISKEGKTEWIQKFGGDGNAIANAVELNFNKVYVVGSFTGNVQIDNLSLTSKGENDIFIAAFYNSGSLIWAKQIGGLGNDYAYSVSANDSSAIYFTGDFTETISYNDSLKITSHGQKDILIAKLDTAGMIMWMKAMGGIKEDIGSCIKTNNFKNVFVTGEFMDTAQFDNRQIISKGETDIFIAKYDSDGNLHWIESYGGPKHDAGNSVVSTKNNEVIIAGIFQNACSFQDTVLKSSGKSDAFILKYNANGKRQWITQIRGENNEDINEISLDTANNIYAIGNFKNKIIFNNHKIYGKLGTEIYLAKYDSLAKFEWAIKAGGYMNDIGQSISLSPKNEIGITGVFKERAWFEKNVINANNDKMYDIYVSKYIDVKEKKCSCKRGGILKWKPFGLLFGYGAFAYEKAKTDHSSFQFEIGALINSITIEGPQTGLDVDFASISQTNGRFILEYRRYLSNQTPRGFYMAPFIGNRLAVINFKEDRFYEENDIVCDYKQIGYAAQTGMVLGYQHILKNCITLDFFIGPQFSASTLSSKKFYDEKANESELIQQYPENIDYTSVPFSWGVRWGFKLGYAF
jgi:hypothetical protein